MSLPILLSWLPRRAKPWIAVALALLMLAAPPLGDWVIDRYVGGLERRLDRVMERMENTPIHKLEMPE